jgi:hypothetical protein
MYTIKKNANTENTTRPRPNSMEAVLPVGRFASPSENMSPAISKYTPLIIAVVSIYG